MRQFLAGTFVLSCSLVALSWFVYIPWFQRLLRRVDPIEAEHTQAWSRWSVAQALRIGAYFLYREFQRSLHPAAHRHGAILRWTYSFPALVGALTMAVGSIAGSLGWLDVNPRP
jgi:hypothetical protein